MTKRPDVAIIRISMKTQIHKKTLLEWDACPEERKEEHGTHGTVIYTL